MSGAGRCEAEERERTIISLLVLTLGDELRHQIPRLARELAHAYGAVEKLVEAVCCALSRLLQKLGAFGDGEM